MRGMTRGQLFELVFWASFALGAFALTLKFNRPIEIYKFGASGWPRAVLGFMILAVLGQLIHDLRRRVDAPRAAAAPERAQGAPRGLPYYARVAGILGVPVLYGLLMQPLGFYFLTPLFIVAVLLLAGERRVKWVIFATALLYAMFLLLFAKLLYVGLPTGNVHPFYDFSNWLLVQIR